MERLRPHFSRDPAGLLDLIDATLHENGFLGDPPTISNSFLQYVQLIERWNGRMNLISERGAAEVVRRHFAESIRAAFLLPTGITTLLDFGSGGGFPGIPIAICRPDIHVSLAESQGKKAAFLRETVRSLNLATEVLNQRVEALPSEWRYDAVTLRAVDRMEEALQHAAARANRFLILLTSRSKVNYPALAPDFSWSAPETLSADTAAALFIGRRS